MLLITWHVIHLPGHVQFFTTPWNVASQAILFLIISWSLPKFISISSVIPFNHLIPLLPSSSFSLFQHQVLFQWIGCSHQVAKVLELQQQPFQWVFRADFLQDRLLWSPCGPRDSQESSPVPQLVSILWLSAFFMVQLSNLYVTIDEKPWQSGVSVF